MPDKKTIISPILTDPTMSAVISKLAVPCMFAKGHLEANLQTATGLAPEVLTKTLVKLYAAGVITHHFGQHDTASFGHFYKFAENVEFTLKIDGTEVQG